MIFFSSRRRHTRCGRDWSSDVCSSDLNLLLDCAVGPDRRAPRREAPMFRSILGFAIFAALAFVALNILFGILGGLFGLALWILKLAAIGFVLYFVLRLVSPSTADKIRDMIKGRPADA